MRKPTEMELRVAEAIWDCEHDAAHEGLAMRLGEKMKTLVYGREDITFREVVEGIEAGAFVPRVLDKYFAMARTAIRAMRDPTAEIIKAGEGPGAMCRQDAADIFTDMIDAASPGARDGLG